MTWFYLPCTELASSQELEALTLELSISSPNLKPFAMSRGKSLTPKSFFKKCKKENYLMPQYIPTCEPSHPSLITFLKKWISSQQVFHVNHFPKREGSRVQMTKDGYGIPYFKLLSKLDLHSYSWRTFQTSLINGKHLMKYQNPFPKSGSILNGQMFERRTLGPTIKETVCSSLLTELENYQTSFLPTPTASDGIRTSKNYGGGNLTLYGKVLQLPTPTASQRPSEGTVRILRNAVLNGHMTLQEANTYNGRSILLKQGSLPLLPTPTTTGNQLCPSEMKKGGAFNNLKAISNLHGGEGNRLSPLFVEWMMGFPTGWTDLEV